MTTPIPDPKPSRGRPKIHTDPKASGRLWAAKHRAALRELTPLQRKVPGFAYTPVEEELLRRIAVAREELLQEIQRLRESLLGRLPDGDPARTEMEEGRTHLPLPPH